MAGQVSLPPGDPGTGSGPGPVGAAGTGGQRTLSVRTCQKYQAEIRAKTPTHAAKNSWRWVAEAGEGDSPLAAWPAALPHGWPGLGRVHFTGRATEAETGEEP